MGECCEGDFWESDEAGCPVPILRKKIKIYEKMIAYFNKDDVASYEDYGELQKLQKVLQNLEQKQHKQEKE